MVKMWWGLIGAAVMVCSAATTTDTTFSSESDLGSDSFGNMLFERTVKIDTRNYTVDNFWKGFQDNGQGDKEEKYTSVATTGTVRITVEATSLCTMVTSLDRGGCSGQKPFVINDEVLDGMATGDTVTLLFQKNYDIDSDTILYENTASDRFYPLDIQRNETYYKERASSKSFFGFFKIMFDAFFGSDGFFSSFFSFGVVDKDNVAAEDIRQRYIANIVAGVDQDHLMEKGVTALETTKLNDPVSLIDYQENTASSGSCNLFFFKFPEDNFFCQFMSGMPFISFFASSSPATVYTVDTIEADTENALVTFAGTYAGIDLTQYQNGTTYVQQSASTGIIGMMIEMMKCFFFGCSSSDEVEEPMDSYYTFTGDTAVNLTFAVTSDGTQIDDFQTFELTGIHSMTGNERSCKVKRNGFIFGWTETFVPGVSKTKDGKTNEEWLDWCDEQMEEATVDEGCSGFGCFFSAFASFFSWDTYEIKAYTNGGKKALLLDLKLTELQPGDGANTLRYKLISIER